jgi:urease accessory protein
MMTRTCPINEITALLQLASAALPIGAFSYSHGLESAVDAGFVTDASSAEAWIASGLQQVIGRCEAPLVSLLYDLWNEDNFAELSRWNRWFLASRESAELRQETEQMGWSLAQLSPSLAGPKSAEREAILSVRPIALPVAYAAVALALNLNKELCIASYLFAWLENQVIAAVKALPLGQLAGQKILTGLRQLIPDIVSAALQTTPEKFSSFAPQLAILSARHEAQYSRLFRS